MSVDDHISAGLVYDELADFALKVNQLSEAVSSTVDDMLKRFGRHVDRLIVNPGYDSEWPGVPAVTYGDLRAVLDKAWDALDRALVEVLDLRDSQVAEDGG